MENEKFLVMSSFSFSHCVFYPFGEYSTIFIQFEIGFCKLFQFGRVKNLLFGKGLKLDQTSCLTLLFSFCIPEALCVFHIFLPRFSFPVLNTSLHERCIHYWVLFSAVYHCRVVKYKTTSIFVRKKFLEFGQILEKSCVIQLPFSPTMLRKIISLILRVNSSKALL